MMNKSRAFTLVELLVVIAIIGILMALLLPAVQSARAAAGRINCVNNMRQVAISVMTHEARKSRLPGWQETIQPGGVVINWAVAIAPDLDMQTIYDGFETGNPPMSVVNGVSVISPVKLLRCPWGPVGTGSFVANVGFIPRASDPSPFSQAVSKSPPSAGYDYWDSGRKENGPFVDRVAPVAWGVQQVAITVTSTDFYDGMSNTMLVSENLLGTNWADVGIGTSFGWIYAADPSTPIDPSYITGAPIAPTVPVPAESRVNGPGVTLQAETARPSSRHVGGVNVAFADGSTRFINEAIQYHVYQSIATMNSRKSDEPHRKYVLADTDLE